MLIVELLLVAYLAVALMSMAQTVEEWRTTHRASLPGMLAGCALCLLWLPMLVAMMAYQISKQVTRKLPRVSWR